MVESKIKTLMKSLGYTDWEITAYFILIKYGPKTALELSKLSKIARSKTYEVVTRLRRKGLVMKVPPMPTKGVTQKFVAIEPKRIFKNKVSDMEELSKLLQEAYKNPINAAFPKVNMYTSKNAVKVLFQDTSENPKSFLIYLADLNLSKILGFSFEHLIDKINSRGYFILKDTPELRSFSKKLKNYHFIKTSGDMSYIISKDRVILDLFKSDYIIIEIISKEAVNTFTDLFNNRLKTKT